MKVLITGTSGFIGKKISVFLNSTYDIYSSEIDLSNLSDVEDLISKLKPDYVIHCAGSSSVSLSIEAPILDFEKNVLTTRNLLESLRVYSAQTHFIYLSSAAVYGNPVDNPIDESSSLTPISPYGYSKVCSEFLIKQYSTIYNISSAVLRVFSVYGEPMEKQVVYDIFRKFETPEAKNIRLYGTGEETRDFIHIQDLCKVIELFIVKKSTGIFNVASGQSISIKQLAEMIKKKLKSDKEIKFIGENRVGDPIKWNVDISKLRNEGFVDFISLEEGLNLYANWFRKRYR